VHFPKRRWRVRPGPSWIGTSCGYDMTDAPPAGIVARFT
jgi:hypothetical protein